MDDIVRCVCRCLEGLKEREAEMLAAQDVGQLFFASELLVYTLICSFRLKSTRPESEVGGCMYQGASNQIKVIRLLPHRLHYDLSLSDEKHITSLLPHNT
jgi:hypothetical protein